MSGRLSGAPIEACGATRRDEHLRWFQKYVFFSVCLRRSQVGFRVSPRKQIARPARDRKKMGAREEAHPDMQGAADDRAPRVARQEHAGGVCMGLCVQYIRIQSYSLGECFREVRPGRAIPTSALPSRGKWGCALVRAPTRESGGDAARCRDMHPRVHVRAILPSCWARAHPCAERAWAGTGAHPRHRRAASWASTPTAPRRTAPPSPTREASPRSIIP